MEATAGENLLEEPPQLDEPLVDEPEDNTEMETEPQVDDRKEERDQYGLKIKKNVEQENKQKLDKIPEVKRTALPAVENPPAEKTSGAGRESKSSRAEYIRKLKEDLDDKLQARFNKNNHQEAQHSDSQTKDNNLILIDHNSACNPSQGVTGSNDESGTERHQKSVDRVHNYQFGR